MIDELLGVLDYYRAHWRERLEQVEAAAVAGSRRTPSGRDCRSRRSPSQVVEIV